MLHCIKWTPKDRYEFLYDLPKGGVVAEIGVHLGRYSEHILDIVRPDKLYLIDSWPQMMIYNGDEGIYGPDAMEIVREKFNHPNIEIIRCDSRELQSKIPKKILDWVYLDTFHRYPTTLEELISISPLMKSTGWIFGHDYDIVTDQGSAVLQSINEFVSISNYELKMLTRDDYKSYGLSR